MTRIPPGRRLPALFLAVLLSACTGPGGSAIHYDVPEIYPGILQGYIDFEEGLDSTAFVPLAPTTESSRQTLDELVSEHALGLRDSPRWQLAKIGRASCRERGETWGADLSSTKTT